MGCSVSIQPNNYFPSIPSPKSPAANTHNDYKTTSTQNYDPTISTHLTNSFHIINPTLKVSPSSPTCSHSPLSSPNSFLIPIFTGFHCNLRAPEEDSNPGSPINYSPCFGKLGPKRKSTAAFGNPIPIPIEEDKEENEPLQNNYYIGNPSKAPHHSHRSLKRAEGHKATLVLKAIVSEDPKKIAPAETIDSPKLFSTSARSDKEKLKMQIEKKFTANLLDLVLPGGKFSARKPEKPDTGDTSKRSARSSISGESVQPSPRATKHEKKQAFNISGLDLSLVGEPEEEGNKTVNARHTPIKKSIFSSVFDTSEITPSPRPAHDRSRFSFLGVSARNLTSNAVENKNKVGLPSILLSEQHRRKFSETSLSSVRETKVLDKTRSEDGQKKINQYMLGKELGRGSFGKVKLAIDSETGKKYAVKIANKKKLSKRFLSKDKSLFSQLQTEIAVMKKMSHSNIVQLYEVIDDPNAEKLYLVMDLVQRGAVMSKHYWDTEHTIKKASSMIRASTEKPGNWKNMLKATRRYSEAEDQHDDHSDKNNNSNSITGIDEENRSLPEHSARAYFRDLILGLDYMHNYADVIHRDIKPENLLVDEYDTLKISDFGVSYIMEGNTLDKRMMKNGAGTKAYLAPEAWLNKKHRGEPLDIWAAGATLYYFLYAKPPFKAGRAQEMKELILNSEPEFPEEAGISQDAIELIKACLRKDPDERITLEEIMKDKWLTCNGKEGLVNREAKMLVVTAEDVSKAFTSKLKATLTIALALKKRLTTARSSLSQKHNLLDLSEISSLDSLE